MRTAFALAAATMLALAVPALAQSAPDPAGAPIGATFSDERIGPDSFRVRISGAQLEWGTRAERYLLYRAAQMTLARGHDNLTLISHNAQTPSEPYYAQCSDCDIWAGWRPYWRWQTGTDAWLSYDPFHDFPDFDRIVNAKTVTQYEASADIVLSRGPYPYGYQQFGARRVIALLAKDLELPPPR